MDRDNIIRAINLVIFTTLLVTSGVMFQLNNYTIARDILFVLAFYVIFTKIENLDKVLRGVKIE